MTWLLVILSDFCATLSPAHFSRYKDELSFSEWQFQHAHWSYENFFKFYGSFAKKTIVDLGCGKGGKTLYYAGFTPKSVTGIDIDLSEISMAKTFQNAKGSKSSNLQFVVGDVHESPFGDEQFDLCISEDGFEHFSSPQKVLDEANRILKPGGRFLILFTPYFGPGGSHLYDWIRLPWAHLVFSDRTMIKAARIIAKRVTLPSTSYRETPEEHVERAIYQFEHFLNRITLRRFKRYLLRSSNWKLVCFHKYCTRKPFYPFLNIPFIAEMFASIFCVLERSSGQRIRPKDFLLKQDRRLKRVI